MKIRVCGGKQLKGHVAISGAKNEALKVMTTCLLTDQEINFQNIPNLEDVTQMKNLLSHIGVSINESNQILSLQAKDIKTTLAPYDIVKKMRASFVILGPLLARAGKAKISLPGGCILGSRPVDVHIKGLQAMGADIHLENGYIIANAKNGLKGAHIYMSCPSWTGTENLMMAATLAKGETVLENAAKEPEVISLANCLRSMGAIISGDGTSTIKIKGVQSLNGTTHTVMFDRIEAGTFACIAALTCGDLTLSPVVVSNLHPLPEMLERAGAKIEYPDSNTMRIYNKDVLKPVDVITGPYPEFSTDLQAQWMATMLMTNGKCSVTETLFENRFMHVPEMCRLNANIQIEHNKAMVTGVRELTGTSVMATDLRASVSLIMAGLVAKGHTTVDRIYHIDRGYEKVEDKLQKIGADIERLA